MPKLEYLMTFKADLKPPVESATVRWEPSRSTT